MPQTTNALFRTRVHDAIRSGLEEHTGRNADDALVTAVASAVAFLDARPDFPLIYGLPDAAAIAWGDADHNQHIALRYGHPGNGAWDYNGKRYSSDELLTVIGTSTPEPLDFRSNPQASPSEYRR